MGSKQQSKSSWVKHLDFIILDMICLQVAFLVAYYLRFPGGLIPYAIDIYATMIAIYTAAQLIVGFASNNYSGIMRRGYIAELDKTLLVSLLSLALTIIAIFAIHTAHDYSRILVFLTAVIYTFFSFFVRTGYKHCVERYLMNHKDKQRAILIVSDEQSALGLVEYITTMRPQIYNLRGVILTDNRDRRKVSSKAPVVATIDSAMDYICREWVDEVLVCNKCGWGLPANFYTVCAEMGVTVHSIINIADIENKKVSVNKFGTSTVLTTSYNSISPNEKFVKRLGDVFFGFIGSIFAIIIILLVGPWIFIASPGPIIFKQTRVGKNGHKFTLFKLRSMYLDAEERKKDYMDQNRVGSGLMFKLDFDPRIIGNKVLPNGKRKTGIGEFIRKTSLDEFPQFFNVLMGDMSLIGTRPPTLDEWNKYDYHHRARLIMKPGITGLWQVSGRSTITDFEEIVKLDTEYIRDFSIENDLKIFFRTIGVLVRRKGAM